MEEFRPEKPPGPPVSTDRNQALADLRLKVAQGELEQLRRLGGGQDLIVSHRGASGTLQ